MDINPQIAAHAIQEGLQRYPAMSSFGPRLVCRPVFGGVTFLLEYETPPPRDHPDSWEFQNAVVKAYKRMSDDD